MLSPLTWVETVGIRLSTVCFSHTHLAVRHTQCFIFVVVCFILLGCLCFVIIVFFLLFVCFVCFCYDDPKSKSVKS